MPIVTKLFDKKRLPDKADVLAPDGSEVRILTRLRGGSMAHFQLPAGQTSRAVMHQSVDELWYILAGRGRMWRSRNNDHAVDELQPELSISIAAGTHFQFQNTGQEPLTAVAVSMPPWTRDDEAVFVAGYWTATV